jgi:hypothetical protein
VAHSFQEPIQVSSLVKTTSFVYHVDTAETEMDIPITYAGKWYAIRLLSNDVSIGNEDIGTCGRAIADRNVFGGGRRKTSSTLKDLQSLNC